MIDDFGHILHITRNFGLLQTPTVIFYYSIAYNWSSIVYHDNMIFQLTIVLIFRSKRYKWTNSLFLLRYQRNSSHNLVHIGFFIPLRWFTGKITPTFR